MAKQFLRLPEVKSRTGLSRATIYARQRSGTFPKAVNLGPRTVAWVASEVEAWADARIEESRKSEQG